MTEPVLIPAHAFIGCAGWTIPRAAAGAFDTEGRHLERYARVFSGVEINSSFYRPHQAKTYARWAESVPASFRFAVKLPRTITHERKLVDIDLPLQQFEDEVAGLENKLGALLVQLPPKQDFDAAVAGHFFAGLRRRFTCLLACEARHPAWFGEAATGLLTELGVTRVIADPAKGQDGPHMPTTAAIYTRLHGSPRIYYSAYDSAYLAQLGADIRTHQAAGREVWCMFDNTASGAAVPDALAALQASA
jgi:uncharacterized protein YecE (DUF72 family)